MNIPEEKRPLYYIDRSFSPELGQDYSNWNNTSDFLPDISIWIWDQLDHYIRHNIKNKKITPDKEIKILSAYKTARKYHETCLGRSTIDTVVTHLYVCELLVQVLIMINGKDWSLSHGYKFEGFENTGTKAFDAEIVKKSIGLSHELHSLFFSTPLDQKKRSKLKDYLMFCPELRKYMFEIERIIPHTISCEENYGGTGSHKEHGKTYHSLHFEMSDYHAIFQPKERNFNQKTEHGKNFPELNRYTVSNSYSDFAVEDESLSDKFISVTRDPYGKTFALAFGQSPVEKQRDIEIRFAIVFILGSLGRYRPWIWRKLEEEDPVQYFALKKFLEYNHLLFPYLILCYLSGKHFTFNTTAVWG